jgi:hypothetical protein
MPTRPRRFPTWRVTAAASVVCRSTELLPGNRSAGPHQVVDTDQVGGVVHGEHDEPEVAEVCGPPSWYPGRRAEHGVVRVFANPGQ